MKELLHAESQLNPQLFANIQAAMAPLMADRGRPL